MCYENACKPLTSAIATRYVKLFLGEAGIDNTVSNPHSTRCVSTNEENNKRVKIPVENTTSSLYTGIGARFTC